MNSRAGPPLEGPEKVVGRSTAGCRASAECAERTRTREELRGRGRQKDPGSDCESDGRPWQPRWRMTWDAETSRMGSKRPIWCSRGRGRGTAAALRSEGSRAGAVVGREALVDPAHTLRPGEQHAHSSERSHAWPVADGGWRMADGGWRAEGGRLRAGCTVVGCSGGSKGAMQRPGLDQPADEISDGEEGEDDLAAGQVCAGLWHRATGLEKQRAWPGRDQGVTRDIGGDNTMNGPPALGRTRTSMSTRTSTSKTCDLNVISASEPAPARCGAPGAVHHRAQAHAMPCHAMPCYAPCHAMPQARPPGCFSAEPDLSAICHLPSAICTSAPATACGSGSDFAEEPARGAGSHDWVGAVLRAACCVLQPEPEPEPEPTNGKRKQPGCTTVAFDEQASKPSMSAPGSPGFAQTHSSGPGTFDTSRRIGAAPCRLAVALTCARPSWGHALGHTSRCIHVCIIGEACRLARLSNYPSVLAVHPHGLNQQTEPTPRPQKDAALNMTPCDEDYSVHRTASAHGTCSTRRRAHRFHAAVVVLIKASRNTRWHTLSLPRSLLHDASIACTLLQPAQRVCRLASGPQESTTTTMHAESRPALTALAAQRRLLPNNVLLMTCTVPFPFPFPSSPPADHDVGPLPKSPSSLRDWLLAPATSQHTLRPDRADQVENLRFCHGFFVALALPFLTSHLTPHTFPFPSLPFPPASSDAAPMAQPCAQAEQVNACPTLRRNLAPSIGCAPRYFVTCTYHKSLHAVPAQRWNRRSNSTAYDSARHGIHARARLSFP
ncbi:uncharacterized protein MYCFIDRAFT_170472 [Pseudocercospora fijiensis CIRAD86]|uniref:Uncharacterized protein n=1 Tax=Pseudocercospora fijiensis (strain CIRAD86) TaxID=383855 RepID=N1QC61_PSEFD|nr:uncharacterized protein MYCFIDRAFT_170472 [Pseudocercospora fijiensis CIRAD86]EME88903.1 hypothetical protein MYCFIDRAFT_170472 [Pseudocercospora fijiensis CIRAD86]